MGFNPFRVIKDTTGKVINPVKKGINQGVDEVSQLPQEALDEIPKLVEEALELAIKEAQKGVLGKAVKILEAAAPDKVNLTIGPVGLEIENVHQRLTVIKSWAKNPPTDKAHIRSMIETIGPSSVSINLSAELALVFVSSSSLSLGMAMTWNTSDFLTRFETIMHSL